MPCLAFAMCLSSHSFFLQSELIERAEKSPLIFPKEKTRGLNALNFNFLLSFLVFLGFWLCVCSQRSGLCLTSPRLHARKVRQKRLPVSTPAHYPTTKAGRLSACPPSVSYTHLDVYKRQVYKCVYDGCVQFLNALIVAD